MSNYTTGEIAKECGVSVRTVQYYDNCGILAPSELSEGGRRLYSEDDLKRMRIICFLRDAELSIKSIRTLFKEKKPQSIISILLAEQEQVLRDELREKKRKLEIIEGIKRELKSIENFSVESIGDIEQVMKEKKKLKKIHLTVLFTGIPVSALQWVAIALWIAFGLWWLFVVWALVAIVYGVLISIYYFKSVAYLCPECHEVFKPKFKESFFAYHTPKLRRLTCPKCGRKRLCLEVYARKNKENNG